MTTTATPVSAITLPTWTDPTSVAALLTAVVSVVAGTLAAIHPGFTLPPVVPESVPAVSLVVAAAAIIYNMVRHSAANSAAVAALAAGQLVVASRSPKVLIQTPLAAAPAQQGIPAQAVPELAGRYSS